ncbi:AbrB/MazE/SpoVT family DNA-binding domain-containing protein [Shouchella clausii]|jgi:transcriptional pleiotropic regulator of transition state genes|uniref:AbrB family transcriptional regulator n=1 Tax=Shouchella clausii TaxID=79880 RepID=A0A268S680_SHOCL|nr:AbrB/MazE/SpoVT family DNA-binding domain-containing protein [Shouchella clausii]PAD42710.1 AbrB family transcriptional regulator [Bacillus sp. 7520-S]SPT77392.1 transition state regulatory protein [Niallia circulans]AST98425.1 AbrB family transcriptional regulator [Shouchella clausii]MBU8597902.1 AbrB/MazE/SpoVT family DNA-binding domain-containing protein [Shouchella clausii]MCM3548198.1 AbrB/MazE/SpoVT family DNA-binding domain-containing protein [Shouchella clausii]
MKATGIVRKVDQLGRIVVPKELRKTMGIDIGSPLEIYVEDDRVIVRKYEPSIKTCMVTGESSEEHLQLANGNVVLSQEAAKQLLDELKQKESSFVGNA